MQHSISHKNSKCGTTCTPRTRPTFRSCYQKLILPSVVLVVSAALFPLLRFVFCFITCQVVEIDEGGTCVSVRNTEYPNKTIKCAYDRVFGPESVQQDVFLGLVPALDTVLQGYNACVLAYGQTGSGKTHTLIGTLYVGEWQRHV